MAPHFSEYVVVYDISENRERTKIDKLLQGFGRRVQKSVFECVMRKRDLKELEGKLNQLKIKSGYVKIYRLQFSSDPAVFGNAPENEVENTDAFIV